MNVYGDQGQSLVIIVLDEEGGSESFQPTYEDGRYRVFIPDSIGEVGDRIMISDEVGGDEILPEFTTTLPEFDDDEADTSEYLIYIILAAVLLVILIVILLLITGKRKDNIYEE